MSHLTYFRPDGVVGVGFEITHCAKKMHSVAWPDRCAERMTDDEAERLRIRIEGKEGPVPKQPNTTLREMLNPSVDSVVPGGRIQAKADAKSQEILDDDDDLGVGDEESSEDDADLPDTELELDSPSEADQSDHEPDQSDQQADHDPEPVSEAQAIRDYLTVNPNATNKAVVEALAEKGIEISSSQVTRQRKNLKDDGVL